MKYLVCIEQAQEYLVELSRGKAGCWNAQLGSGRSVEMELRGVDEEGAVLVVVDGELRRIRADELPVEVQQAGEVILANNKSS